MDNIDLSPLTARIGDFFQEYIHVAITQIDTQEAIPELTQYQHVVSSKVSGALNGEMFLCSDETLIDYICKAFMCQPDSIAPYEVLTEVLNILLGNVENYIHNEQNQKLIFQIPKNSSKEEIEKQQNNSCFSITFSTKDSLGCCIYIQN